MRTRAAPRFPFRVFSGGRITSNRVPRAFHPVRARFILPAPWGGAMVAGRAVPSDPIAMRSSISRTRSRFSRRHVSILALAALMAAPFVAGTQASATPVVQQLPSNDALDLREALSRLGRNPRDVEALVDAGNAASALGDFDAAIGFFKRAQELTSRDPRVLSGLAGAYALKGDPVTAIPLYAQAQSAGANAGAIGGDRGLAYDLVGDPVTARRYYQQALAARPGDEEVTRRLAVSYAISGDEKAMTRTITPLLRDQDKAAWRTRAFALAILGKSAEATKVTRSLLPGNLADSITPYLDYMPRLTPAQQAAAANLGIFPRASEIGHDSPAIAAFAPRSLTRTDVAAADRALIPGGAALGPSGAGGNTAESRAQARAAERNARREAKRQVAQAARVAPPEVQPSRQAGSVDEPAFAESSPPRGQVALASQAPSRPATSSAELPPLNPAPATASGELPPLNPASRPAPASPSGELPPLNPAPRSAAATASGELPPLHPAPAPVASPAPVTPAAAAPGFNLSSMPASRAPTAPDAAPPPPPPPSFSSLFNDLGRPQATPTPVSGAVDIRKIEPAHPPPPPPPKPPAPPPPPKNPSRIWVQIGIGQKLSALAYDWNRYVKAEPELLKRRKAYTTRLNRTNRLLVGPFDSDKEANAFLAKLKKADHPGAYPWTSPEGQAVEELSH